MENKEREKIWLRISMRIMKALRNVNAVFKSFSMTTLFYQAMFFTKAETLTLKFALDAKRKKRAQWYQNYLLTPLIVIYIPYILTLLSDDFGKVNFHKSLIELTLTGSFTMLGINIMRSSLTLINEKIDDEKLPEALRKNIWDDIESIKSKLRHWIQGLTIVNALFYVIQIEALFDADNPKIYYWLIPIFSLTTFSIFIARLISVIQTNFFDNQNLLANWVRSLSNNNQQEFKNLEDQINTDGL